MTQSKAAANTNRGLPETKPAEQTNPIPISIISNSRLLREGMPLLLSPHLNVELVGTYPGDFQPPTVPQSLPGHVALLDGRVEREALIQWIHYWQRLTPPTSVVAFELPNNIDTILTCIEAGVSGYTLLGASIGEVGQAISLVHQGVAYSSPEATAQLFVRLAAFKLQVPPPAMPSLTPRELEVLYHIAKGYSNQEIATALWIELRTVKQHIHNILGKLGLHSRAEAVRFAFAQGWFNPDPGMSSTQE
jgi:DNA-binding NarL/FixJ family response regulator